MTWPPYGLQTEIINQESVSVGCIELLAGDPAGREYVAHDHS